MLSTAHQCVAVTDRRPTTARLYSGSSGDVNTMQVPAETAAAWPNSATTPAYDREWPECRAQCLEGHCALEWYHPACCFVRRNEYEDRMARPYGKDDPAAAASPTTAQPPADDDNDNQASLTSTGYWLAHDFFCWRD